MKRSVRRLPALILAAGVMIGLAACTPPATTLAGCVAPFQPGDNSNAVTTTGKVGTEPKADFPTPLIAKDGQVTVLERGDGAIVYPTNTVEYALTLFDPTTGELVQSGGYDSVIRAIAGGTDAAARIAECVPAGSRLAFVGTAGSLVPDDETPDSEGQTYVVILDVLDTYLGKANGWDQLPQAGMPSIVLAPDGTPGFIVPNSAPPSDLRIALLKAGAGDTVKEGDNVVLQYSGLIWGQDTPFDSSWTSSQSRQAGPVELSAQDFTKSDDQNGVVPGFAKALIGQKVGSQVLVVIPPEFGYPDDQRPQSIPSGSTLIFVIDILKTTTPEG